MAERKYDSTVARIAGNLLSGRTSWYSENRDIYIEAAVQAARKIVAEVKRTEPETA